MNDEFIESVYLFASLHDIGKMGIPDKVLLKPGSVVVQRGTNHAWANRSGQPCRMLFVLVGGRFDPSLGAPAAGH